MLIKILSLVICAISCKLWAIEPQVELSVFANEAVINVYTFDYHNWPSRQKDMAAYFFPKAWAAYLNAINQSNILKLVMKNEMTVNAVATFTPSIKTINPTTYQVQLPILVTYASKTSTQKQNLNVTLEVIKSNSTSTRGYAINQFVAHVDSPPCVCQASQVTIV